MAPSSSAATTSVQVAVRIRPQTAQDTVSIPARFQRSVIHAISTQAVSIDPTPSTATSSGINAAPSAAATASPAKKQTFTFDQVHGPDTTQYNLFTSTAEPLVSRFLEGFNCTVLAYGQTSSGKTYSMTGVDLDADPSDAHNDMGIIPRSIATIFNRAAAMKQEKGDRWTCSIKGSFIEIYNEDLIDLLSLDDGSGGRREVQIREDKDGHIIWGGLREIAVKNANEVMTLIRQGTSIRRTNETEMNAQSSRSHAIFSLTLTQKKYTGSGTPPRTGTPGPGRSPSRLARPASTLSTTPVRVGSPTFGRPPTPSFASAMGRGGGLRPSSALGSHGLDGRSKNVDDDVGEWVTIVSKFHFVDLAGSERLKRTAAVGERIKEGISINSGLLALGNVISALGDPSRAKSHTSSHVPYRDSKLTRLLQDSLGGNAHTLMIACVSPAEWNAGETINTLKYANRARNIKNRAVVTEKEEGWDDMEWLQNMVTRLRKEVKTLKDGGAVPNSNRASAVEVDGASKKVLNQMVELQSNYEGLREKFVERTEELTRLRRELGERHRSSMGGAVGGTAKYEEIVGPVIEEYEKTISAMEAELSLNRAALRHTNDLVEEKEEEFSALTERHAATEMYVEELKSRVGKLAEREASTEAYIRDLEEKVKSFEENSMSSNDSVSDLKREIARHKESEEQSAQYIADLESRLSKSDESILALRDTIEDLEQDVESRKAQVEDLTARLKTVIEDGDAWRSDLEERERKLKELEAKMDMWETQRQQAGEERIRIGGLARDVQAARRSLEQDMSPDSTSDVATETAADDEGKSVEKQLAELQETHAATLADLSSVTKKYRDALSEISDLAAQIQEARLSPSRSESPDTVPDVPQFRRRAPSLKKEIMETQVNGAGRRHFFRHAASTESLHSRSQSQSLSLSQELSSARSFTLSSPVINGSMIPRTPSSPRINASGLATPTHERSVASLEKEIMRLQEVLKEREAEIETLENSLKATEHSNVGTPENADAAHVLPNGHDADVRVASPKMMRQFEAIRESMEFNQPPDLAPSDVASSEAGDPIDRLNELMLSMAQKESQHKETVDKLNEQLSRIQRQHDDLSTLSRDQALNMSTELEALRGQHGSALAQLEELQQKEALLVEDRDSLEKQHVEEIERLRLEQESLLQSLQDREAEFDAKMAQLAQEHEAQREELRKQLEASSFGVDEFKQQHDAEMETARARHEDQLRQFKQEADEAVQQAKQEYESSLAKLQASHEEAIKSKEDEHSSLLQHTEEEYYTALSKLRMDHADVLARKESEHAALLERLREDHASEIRMLEIAREGSLTESQTKQSDLLQQLQKEHASAIEKKEATFAEDLRQAQEQHAAALAKKEDDHRVSVEKLKQKHANKVAELADESEQQIQALNASLAESQKEYAEHVAKVEELQLALNLAKEEHSAAIEALRTSHAEELTKVQAERDSARTTAEAQYHDRFTTFAKDCAEEVSQLKAEHQQVVTDLENSLVALQDKHQQDLENTRNHTETLLAQGKEQVAKALADLETMNAQERDMLIKDRDLLLRELETYKGSTTGQTAALETLQEQHQAELSQKDDVIGELQKTLSDVNIESNGHQDELVRLRTELEQMRIEQTKLQQEASLRGSLEAEVARQKSILAETQEKLRSAQDSRDALLAEKTKQDNVVRELQTQLTRTLHNGHDSPVRPHAERNTSFTRINGTSKLPPLTPPPSVPPPPAPTSVKPASAGPSETAYSMSSQSTNLRSSSSSHGSQPDSPSTSVNGSMTNGSTPTDARLNAQLEDQGRQIEEQEAMIKTLNKQLSHCESDLQAHMDMVSTLETSLGDSEKNLRKARMQATELARERDTLNSQIERLRHELEHSRNELVNVRHSLAEEKQSLENRLAQESRATERVRQQLDMRVEEIRSRKSKFVCL